MSDVDSGWPYILITGVLYKLWQLTFIYSVTAGDAYSQCNTHCSKATDSAANLGNKSSAHLLVGWATSLQ